MPSSSKIGYDPHQSKEWKEIQASTRVKLTGSISVNAWVLKFRKLVEEADYYYLKGELEKAYINYVISLSIYMDCLQKNPEYSKVKETKQYDPRKLKAESTRCLEHAEKLKEEIFNKLTANHKKKPILGSPEKQNYNPNLVKPVVNSISRPDNTKKLASVISKLPKKILPTTQTSSQFKINPYSTSTKNAKTLANIPTIPGKLVSPESLVPILNSYRLNQAPSVLFIDVRPTHDFVKERLSVTHQVNIDPIILSTDVGSHKIEEHLKIHGSDPSNLFYYRNRFDYVVILDENSTRVLPPRMFEGSGQDNAIHNLIQAITEYEPTKLLKNYPILLIGGLSAWKKHTGTTGIIRVDGYSPSTSDYSARSQVISPARSKPFVKTLDEFFQRQPGTENSVKPSMQFPYSPSDKFSPGSFASPEQKVSSPLSRDTQLDASSDSFHSFLSPTSSGRASLRSTVFDNPLYGFTPTKKDLKNYLKEEPSQTLEKIYQPPPNIFEPTPEPILKPIKLPPPIPPKPSSLNKRRAQTPPLVSSLSYAMNIGTTGLKNLGNTCYMNSIIQCINGTIPLARYFLDGSFKRHINRENPLGSGGLLVEAYEELVRGLWTEGASNISPTKFKTTVGKISYQFKGTEQQDSQEFLNFFLDGLHEDLNLVKQRPPPDQDDDDYLEKLPDQEAADLAWEKYLARNNSIIVSLFQGQLKSRLQCKICQKTSTTFNSFMSLSLPIPYRKPPPVSLIDCLDLFIQEETLEGDNAWNCPRCKRPCPSTKKLTISRLPDVLLIHLKRFSYEGPFRNKLDALVDFPLRGLDLSRYVPPTAPKSSILSPKGTPIGNSYDLYAVSNHFGSLTGGHYTASVRSGYGGKWHYFDDSRVTIINENDAVTKAAYNLFYVRTNRDTAHL